MNLSKQHEIRQDGRFPNELRRMLMGYEIINNKGYISLSHGLTQVSASLCKPKDRCAFNVTVVFQDTARIENAGDRLIYILQSRLAEIFEPIVPTDTQINIELVVAGDDGSLLAALVNVTTLCLCFHGIPMLDMCTAVCLNDMYDLTTYEQSKGYVVTVVSLVHSQKVVHFKSVGKCQKEALTTALAQGMTCCNVINKQFIEFLSSIAR